MTTSVFIRRKVRARARDCQKQDGDWTSCLVIGCFASARVAGGLVVGGTSFVSSFVARRIEAVFDGLENMKESESKITVLFDAHLRLA